VGNCVVQLSSVDYKSALSSEGIPIDLALPFWHMVWITPQLGVRSETYSKISRIFLNRMNQNSGVYISRPSGRDSHRIQKAIHEISHTHSLQ